MPKLEVLRLAASLTPRGLSAAEARQIAAEADAQMKTAHGAQQVKEAVAAEHGADFTKAGAAAWRAVTGIEVGARNDDGASKQKGGNALAVRASNAKGAPAKAAASPWDARVTPDIARAMKPPSPFLQQYVFATDPPVVAELMEELTRLEATQGDANGVLVPRDLDHADETLRGLMERVWKKEGGKKSIPLQRVHRRVKEVVVEFLNDRNTRQDPKHETAYTSLVRGAVAWLADEYQANVLTGAQTKGDFFRARGFTDGSDAKMRELLPEVAPRPDDEGAALLWQKQRSGAWSSKAFNEAAQRTVAEGRALEDAFPHLFAKDDVERPPPKSHFGSARTAAGDLSELVAQWRDDDVLISRSDIVDRANADPAFVKKWGALTEARYRTWQRHNPDLFPDLRSKDTWIEVLGAEVKDVRAAHPRASQREIIDLLRPRHPSIGTHHLEAISAANPGLFAAGGPKAVTDRGAQAIEVGRRAREWAQADVLVDRDEIIKRLNADKDFVAAHSTLTVDLYKNLGRFPGADFPRLRDRATWVPVLKAEVEGIFANEPGLTIPELTERLRDAHPNITAARVSDLLQEHPDLRPKAGDPVGPRPYAEVADRISAILKRDPQRSYPRIVADLKGDYPWIDTRGVGYVVTRYLDASSPVRAARAVQTDTARESLTVQALYDLVLRLHPPGTTQDVLLAALNVQMEQRGVPGFNSKVFQAKRGSSLDVHTEIAAAIVAEYAAAAPKGASEDAILDAVAADYPTLTRMGMRHLRLRWVQDPDTAPALAGFFDKKGGLSLTGLGAPPRTPRYLGGWEVDRAVLGGGADEAKELAHLAQQARIPLHLPMLDGLLNDLGNSAPFKNKNVMMVSHFLASHVPLALALKQAGARFDDTVMVGTPYGSNGVVVDTLRDMGFDLRVPTLSVPAYEAEVEKALDAIVARHRENGQPIVVLDDGGLVADLLHSKDKYKDVLGAFKIVEQTTGGILQSEKHALQVPIVNAARSKTKAREAEFIGKAVAAKVLQGLRGLGEDLTGKKAVIGGYGMVGRELARQLRDAGVKVTVIEPSANRRKDAEQDGFTPRELTPALLRSTDLYIGASGVRSLKLEDMRHLKDGAVIASASSKRKELDMPGLEGAASSAKKIKPSAPTLTLPTRAYELDGKSIVVVGDGWPVNFDGDVEDIAPEDIQLTRALMFAGALQASRIMNGPKNVGLVPFDPEMDKELLARFPAARKTSTGAHPSREPGEWRSIVQDLAAAMKVEERGAPNRSAERERAQAALPKVKAWFARDPMMKREELLELLNADAEFTKKFGQISLVQFDNMKHLVELPNFRNGSAWKPVLLEEIKALVKKRPSITRSELLVTLEKKYPRIKRHHVHALGAEFPDDVPTSRPELRR